MGKSISGSNTSCNATSLGTTLMPYHSSNYSKGMKKSKKKKRKKKKK